MEKLVFKEIVGRSFKQYGCEKKSGNFYFQSEDLIIVIDLQKSNYSNSYYINLGYIVKELNQNVLKPKVMDGDVRTRFDVDKNGATDLFELDNLSDSELTNILEINIKKYVVNVTTTEDLKLLLAENPNMLFQTSMPIRQMMNFKY